MSDLVGYYYYLSNTKGPPGDRIGPIVEPFHEAFEQVRDRFTAIPGLHRKGQAWARTWFVR
jgi:hypothetical protein